MANEESAPKSVTMTPQIEPLALSARLKTAVERVATLLAPYDEDKREYVADHDLARATCLAVTRGDEAKATALLADLIAGVAELNAALDKAPAAHGYPVF